MKWNGLAQQYLIFIAVLIYGAPAFAEFCVTIERALNAKALTKNTVTEILADTHSVLTMYYTNPEPLVLATRATGDLGSDAYKKFYAKMSKASSARKCSKDFWALMGRVALGARPKVDLSKSAPILSDYGRMAQECLEYSKALSENNSAKYPNHVNAIDAFFEYDEPDQYKGPNVMAMTGGIVISASNGWKGTASPKLFEGGGSWPERGNSVLIYNPQKKQFYYYGHLFNANVKPGQIVKAGQVIGLGGATGSNAWPSPLKHMSHKHVHFEIRKVEEDGSISQTLEPGKTVLQSICEEWTPLLRRQISATSFNISKFGNVRRQWSP